MWIRGTKYIIGSSSFAFSTEPVIWYWRGARLYWQLLIRTRGESAEWSNWTFYSPECRSNYWKSKPMIVSETDLRWMWNKLNITTPIRKCISCQGQFGLLQFWIPLIFIICMFLDLSERAAAGNCHVDVRPNSLSTLSSLQPIFSNSSQVLPSLSFVFTHVLRGIISRLSLKVGRLELLKVYPFVLWLLVCKCKDIGSF